MSLEIRNEVLIKQYGTIWALCPGTGTYFKGITQAPFLGTGTGLNGTLSVPTLFPCASLQYKFIKKIAGIKLKNSIPFQTKQMKKAYHLGLHKPV